MSLRFLIAAAAAVLLHLTLVPAVALYLQPAPVRDAPAEGSWVWDAPPAEWLPGENWAATLRWTGSLADAPSLIRCRVVLSSGRTAEAEDAVVLDATDVVVQKSDGRASAALSALSRPADAAGPQFLIAAVEASGRPAQQATAAVWMGAGGLPAVKASELVVPKSVQAGGLLEVGYAVINAGDGWDRRGGEVVLLSADPQASPDDLVLGQATRTQPLGPGQSLARPAVLGRVPLQFGPGDYFVIVQPRGGGDSGKAERGASIAANGAMLAAVRVEPATHADLALTWVDVPREITPGQVVALRFDVTNLSPVDTGDALWADRVYLSADDQLDAGDVRLLSQPRMMPLPGGTRYRSGPHALVVEASQITSPAMYLLVVADDEDAINEREDEDNNLQAVPFTVLAEADRPPPQDIELGLDDAPPRVTVAWIPHSALVNLLAQKSRTLQPVVQSQADPSPDAPLIPDPRDTGRRESTAAPPSPPAPPAEDATDPSQASTAGRESPPIPADAQGQAPAAAADTSQVSPPDAAASTTPAQRPAPTPAPQPVAERPTSAPRDEREADPAALLDSDRVRPGEVLVGPGLEVRTFRPEFSAAARGFAVPRNPVAEVTFAPDGTVIAARLTTSSGFANVDSPLLSSLYRWKAVGPRLADRKSPFTFTLTILLSE